MNEPTTPTLYVKDRDGRIWEKRSGDSQWRWDQRREDVGTTFYLPWVTLVEFLSPLEQVDLHVT